MFITTDSLRSMNIIHPDDNIALLYSDETIMFLGEAHELDEGENVKLGSLQVEHIKAIVLYQTGGGGKTNFVALQTTLEKK